MRGATQGQISDAGAEMVPDRAHCGILKCEGESVKERLREPELKGGCQISHNPRATKSRQLKKEGEPS